LYKVECAITSKKRKRKQQQRTTEKTVKRFDDFRGSEDDK
jgi:hypothetical protein